MSVTVKHLNADSSFLLTFSPDPTPRSSERKADNSPYTVLIDPWLSGSSVISAPWFAITRHNVPSAIQHLSEIEEPDVVVISQNKPDHCHKETLLQLRPEAKSIIAAEPGAARTIRSWNHFDPNRIHGLLKYDARSRFGNSLRLRIPPLSPNGHPGEINISFIRAKNYLTGLHNAFGITYQPPTHSKVTIHVPTVELKQVKYFHVPLTATTAPPSSPPQPPTPLYPRAQSLDMPRRSSSVYSFPRKNSSFPRPRKGSSVYDLRKESIILPQPRKASSIYDLRKESLLPQPRKESSTYEMPRDDSLLPQPLNLAPGKGHRPQFSRSSGTQSSEFLPLSEYDAGHAESAETITQKGLHSTTFYDQATITYSNYDLGAPSPDLEKFDFKTNGKSSLDSFQFAPTLLTPPQSPVTISALPSIVPTSTTNSNKNPASHQRKMSSISTTPVLHTITPARPKAVSILYTPHGISLSDLHSYISTHLVRIPGALPLTVLLHSFDLVQNPWYLGGNVMHGAPGGVAIAQALMARCWVSAHDEPKDDRGLAVKQLKVERSGVEDVKRRLWQGQDGQELRSKGWVCDVRSLDVGKEMWVGGQERDLCAGTESAREKVSGAAGFAVR